MKSRGILFKGEMVRALLDGRKSQTRRLVKMPPASGERVVVDPGGTIFGPGPYLKVERTDGEAVMHPRIHCPYGYPGDRLWVKEAYRLRADQDGKRPSEDWWKSGAWYHADDETLQPSGCGGGAGKLRPSIFMPRWASRIELEVTRVRAERLHDITEEDAKAEGVEPFFTRFPSIGRDQKICDGEYARDAEHRASYACLWDEINGDKALWVTNSWVWAIEFKRVERTSTETA